MLTVRHRAIAVALIENSTWTWELKVDDCGLLRWYLDGMIGTNLRGNTLTQAEAVMRRFVGHSLRGELKITYQPEHIGPDSETARDTGSHIFHESSAPTPYTSYFVKGSRFEID